MFRLLFGLINAYKFTTGVSNLLLQDIVSWHTSSEGIAEKHLCFGTPEEGAGGKKGKVCIQARRPIRPVLNSSFCSTK